VYEHDETKLINFKCIEWCCTTYSNCIWNFIPAKY